MGKANIRRGRVGGGGGGRAQGVCRLDAEGEQQESDEGRELSHKQLFFRCIPSVN